MIKTQKDTVKPSTRGRSERRAVSNVFLKRCRKPAAELTAGFSHEKKSLAALRTPLVGEANPKSTPLSQSREWARFFSINGDIFSHRSVAPCTGWTYTRWRIFGMCWWSGPIHPPSTQDLGRILLQFGSGKNVAEAYQNRTTANVCHTQSQLSTAKYEVFFFFLFLFAEAHPSSPSRTCFTVDFWIVVSFSFKEGEED